MKAPPLTFFSTYEKKFFHPKRPPQKTIQHTVQNNVGGDGEETPKKRPK
jgi:hypothetical protein